MTYPIDVEYPDGQRVRATADSPLQAALIAVAIRSYHLQAQEGAEGEESASGDESGRQDPTNDGEDDAFDCPQPGCPGAFDAPADRYKHIIRAHSLKGRSTEVVDDRTPAERINAYVRAREGRPVDETPGGDA